MASCSDTDAGLAPMSSLGVVSMVVRVSPCPFILSSHAVSSSNSLFDMGFAIGVAVPDGVVGPQSNPLRDRAVLLLCLRKLLLRAERLVGLS